MTGGNNHAFGVVDGLSRCDGSKLEGFTTRVLHLSESTGMQHGPSLAARIVATESVKEDDYGEHNGVRKDPPERQRKRGDSSSPRRLHPRVRDWRR